MATNPALCQIEACDVFLFLLSGHSLSSPYCMGEYEEAACLQRPVLGLKIQRRLALPEEISALHWADFSHTLNDVDEYRRLVRDINRHGATPKGERQCGPTPLPRVKAEPKGCRVWLRRLSLAGIVAILVAVVGFPKTVRDSIDALEDFGIHLPFISIAAANTETPTMTATEIPPPTFTLTPIPDSPPTSVVPDAIATELEMTVSARLVALQTEQAQTATAAVIQTATAASWTATPSLTPTPDTSLANPVTANAQWTPVVQDFDGVPMARVPAGCFMMGSENGADDEKPVHEVCFEQSFWVDVYEVTNAQFARFGGQAANEGDFTGPQQPRDRVTWFEARDFCALRGARLPTEAEWEYAARGPDGLTYPWGNQFIADNAVFADNSGSQSAEVGSRPGGMSWVGAYDLSGNLWEWTSSLYQPYPYDATDGRESNDDRSSSRVLRGGSWSLYDLSLRAANRAGSYPDGRYYLFGFRCARFSF